MKILFYLGHPAHFYLANSLASQLKDNNKIIFVARAKDVLLNLLKDCEYKTIIISKKERGKSKLSIILTVLKREICLFWICLRYKPDILLGTDIVITHIGKIFRKPAFIFNEDDEAVVPFLAKYGFKYATGVLSPRTCKFNKYHFKKIEYEGFHKLTYLHPKYFKPNRSIIEKYNLKTPYFLIRLSSLSAHHDKNIKGLNSRLIKQIIDKLEEKGNVYLSSERFVYGELYSKILKIEPLDIHHVLFFADLLISDSQSMSVESALLGTYSIRFSDFAGKIGVLNELEQKYNLTKGVSTENEEGLMRIIDEAIKIEKRDIQTRREEMLTDKIDVTSFMVWFIENYPESKKIMKENPDYQFRFR